MITIRHGPNRHHRNADASIGGLPQPFGTAARALAWWHQRQQRRRELKLLCAPEFAGYRRAMRSRERWD